MLYVYVFYVFMYLGWGVKGEGEPTDLFLGILRKSKESIGIPKKFRGFLGIPRIRRNS